MKILLIALSMNDNLGEHLVVQCSKYLLDQRSSEAIHYVMCDLYGRVSPVKKYTTRRADPAYEDSRAWNAMDRLVQGGLSVLSRALRPISKNAFYRVRRIKWRLDPNGEPRLRSYFAKRMQGADLVMFAGAGIIEYSYNGYQDAIELIVRTAARLKKPVVFSAVGLVGEANPRDARFKVMRRALCSGNVRLITVRDGEERMNQLYLAACPRKARGVSDSAVWAAETLGMARRTSDVIGVGLIRETAFDSYDAHLPYADVLALYRALVEELEARGHAWRLFTNGFVVDQQMGEALLRDMGRDPALLLARPRDTRELLAMLSGFNGVLAGRLHACISAYSLGIPAVALSWNDKLDCFMQLIGYPERALGGERLRAETVIDALERALAEGYDPAAREAYRQSIVQGLADALKCAQS